MSGKMDTCTETKIIYVRLLNEGVDVWRPVYAKEIKKYHFEIEKNQAVAEDEEWEFSPGARVVCKEKEEGGKSTLVATGLW